MKVPFSDLQESETKAARINVKGEPKLSLLKRTAAVLLKCTRRAVKK